MQPEPPTITPRSVTIAATPESFEEDIRVQLLQQLQNAGYALDPSSLGAHSVISRFLEVRSRVIPRQSRRVQRSRELQARSLTDAQTQALLTIEAESLAGEDLNPRRTRSERKKGFSDDLLNDWAIQHLHLGPQGAGKMGLTGGTKELLFAFVGEEVLYLIELLDHDAFTTYGLLEILHDNWPEALALYLPRTIRGLEQPRPTPDELKAFREDGINGLVRMPDGTIYSSPGGGLTPKRTSANASRMAVRVRNNIRDVYATCVRSAATMAETIREERGMVPTDLQLTLSLNSKFEYVVSERQSGVTFAYEFAPTHQPCSTP